jgi:micrococcal nuclease
MRIATALAVLAALLAVPVASSRPHASYVVERVIDGDTIVLTSGTHVRLVQIDAPELSSGECYAASARTTLARLLPTGSSVRLELDTRLDRVDRYGRTLAYVRKGTQNVNVTLVARGAASVWFYDGARGRYAAQLMSSARAAKAAPRGLWKACPRTRLDPLSGVSTGTARTSSGSCDASYPDDCIPPPPPDLDCADVRHKLRVRPPDPHHFDGDRDGWGCESYG